MENQTLRSMRHFTHVQLIESSQMASVSCLVAGHKQDAPPQVSVGPQTHLHQLARPQACRRKHYVELHLPQRLLLETYQEHVNMKSTAMQGDGDVCHGFTVSSIKERPDS